MTSFPKRITWKLSPSWMIPAVFFILLMAHGSVIGLTDDEAYYWVLAQRPALGYAFHPPAVAWLIFLSETLLGWAFGPASAALVRFPGAVCASLTLYLGLRWLSKAGTPSERLGAAGLTLLSFAGIFALSWMMVPDLPLLLGWSLVFVSAWEITFEAKLERSRLFSRLLFLALGVAISVLSKYSGVLVGASALLALSVWSPSDRKRKAIGAVFVGGVLGSLPFLVWNAQHEWASILWQLRDRHGEATLSWVRYGRFWAIQILAAGPLVGFVGWILLRWAHGRENSSGLPYAGIWILPPALIFGAQPLWADFKPHWAFIAWWPALLLMARSPMSGIARAQRYYGLLLGAIVWISCHFPIGGWFGVDPRWDVTNDLFGWKMLPGYLRSARLEELPVVGSRYQTASQAAFALGSLRRVTLLPRDLKAKDEWPDLDVSDGVGPDWPRLKSAVLFVSDIRYSAPPEFPGARCVSLSRIHELRSGFPAKWIEVWKCEPDASRS